MENLYMQEYKLYDGEVDITFNIIGVDTKRSEINLAVTNIGKISFPTYDLYEDKKGLYFEYGPDFTKIYIDDFEIV
ncbi:MAG: hypothetical protein IKM18_00270 [Clostridia bacterium]|nr:hypothetical protein [Clostridia bacterium]